MGDQKKKKVAVIAVSSLVLVAMVVAVTVGVSNNGNTTAKANAGAAEGEPVSKSLKSIKTICEPTEFNDVCVDTLSKAAGNTTEPKDLVKIAYNVTIDYISNAAKQSETLKELEKDHRAAQALENCKELLEYAINDLNQSLEAIGQPDMTKIDAFVMDLKVWLSAAITYQETCLDGFENTTGNAGETMRNALKTSSELTRNGLAIITKMSESLHSLQIPLSRRLLSISSDGFPVWASATQRRLLQVPTHKIAANVVVAKDGSGNYKTINEALKAVPKTNQKNVPFVVYIKAGVYAESVLVAKNMNNVMFIGDGPTKTKITGRKNFIDGTNTYNTATVTVQGYGFTAKDIGFENSAGAEKHQAVALLVQSDASIFFNCQMDGYQDTLYVHTYRQFYSQCTISGTIDFIFGNAQSVFQNCRMVVRRPLDNQQTIVTAQGRKDPKELGAIVLQNCFIQADPALLPVVGKIKSYLGRPWKEYSRTIIMNTQIDAFISPEGWLPWMGDFALKTLFYAEYNNRGPGANLAGRVKWGGIKTPLTKEQALSFTPGKYMLGDSWIPATGVPYLTAL